MSNPRPDTDEVMKLLEDETNLHWTLQTDEPDLFSAVTEIWKFQAVWDGKGWRLEIYDASDPQFDDNEPKWALGRMRNGTEVLKEIPGFIPTEVRA